MKRIAILAIVGLLSLYSYAYEDFYRDYLWGDYQAGIEKAKYSKDDRGLYFLGLVYLKMGDYKVSRKYLRMMLNRFPKTSLYQQGLIKLIDTYFLEGNYRKAKALYKDVLRKYSSFNYLPHIYLRLAQIAAKEGDWPNKQKYLEIIEEKYPSSVEKKLARILKTYPDYFTVQIGAFSNKSNALSLKEQLQLNYPVYIVKEKTKDLTLYKVRVGKFSKRNEAKRISLKLLKEGYPARIYP